MFQFIKTAMVKQIVSLSLLLDHQVDYQRKIDRLVREKLFVKNNQNKFDSLTRREVQIIELLLKGFNNPQIANRLYISRRTVEQHRKNINKKLHIKSYADLFRYGYSFDLI